MPDPSYHAGGEGQALIAGTDYGATGWDFTDTIETDESTSTKNYVPARNMTFKTVEPTKRSGSGSVKFKYDSNQEPFPAIEVGTKVTLKLYKAYLGSNINVPKALITSTPISNPGMNGIFEITVNFETYGEYTIV